MTASSCGLPPGDGPLSFSGRCCRARRIAGRYPGPGSGRPGCNASASGSVRVTARCRSSRAAAVSTGLLICRQAAYLKVSSIGRARGIAPLSPKPSASCADVSPHGRSSNASGSACISAMICVLAWNPRREYQPPGRLSAAGPRTSAPASRPGPATARPRLRRPADAPPPPLTASRVRPRPPGTGPALRPNGSAAPPAAGAGKGAS
jgi:hypothetical protein